MGVTRLLLLEPFYTIQTQTHQTFLGGVYAQWDQNHNFVNLQALSHLLYRNTGSSSTSWTKVNQYYDAFEMFLWLSACFQDDVI